MSDNEQPAETETPSPALTLGQTLQNARLAHDLTLEQVATELRIEVKQLKALENNRFAEIGVPVFVKGYLKQYGQRLGLDNRDLLAAYYHQTDLTDVQIQPNRTIKLRDERQITVWFLAAIVLLAVVVGLAVWWWNGGNLELTGRSSNSNASATTAMPAPQPVDAAPTTAAPIEQAPATPIEQAPTISIEQVPVAPVEQPPVEAVSTEPTPVSEAVVDDAVESPAETNVIPASDPASLELTFNAESWAEVTDARGERLLRDLYRAGRQVTVRGEPPFDIVIGNADAVRLVVAGADYPIPTRGREGERASFRVDVAEE